jgi:hypothetical protein
MMNLLDKYKAAWREEPSLNESMLTDHEIRSWLYQRTARTDRMYRKGIIFDLIIKGLLAVAVIGIVILFRSSQGSWLVSAVLGTAVLTSFLYEWKILRQIPNISTAAAPIRDMLRERISFFNRSYLRVLLIIAVSNPVLIFTGGMYYFYFRYGEIRPLDLEDFIVFSLFLIAGYTISAFFQIKNFRFHIRQLEESLADLNGNKFNKNLIRQQRQKRQRIIAMTILAVITGILLFLLLLSQ